MPVYASTATPRNGAHCGPSSKRIAHRKAATVEVRSRRLVVPVDDVGDRVVHHPGDERRQAGPGLIGKGVAATSRYQTNDQGDNPNGT